MGCMFGAHLSPHADVTLIGRWPDQLHALRRGPLRLFAPDGTEDSVRLRATDDLDAVGAVDIALVVTKTPKTAAAADAAARVLAPGGLVISLQNGLGNQAVIARVLGAERVALGVTTIGASTRGQPGMLYLGGTGSVIMATRPAIDARMRAFAALCVQARLETELVENIDALVWGKLAVNAAINPLTAILCVRNGVLLESEWTRNLMQQAVEEVATVAEAQNIHLGFPDAAAHVERVTRLTAHNQSSMLQDVLRGVETEINAICGAVVAAGAASGIATPANSMLFQLVKAIEATYTARRSQ
ncbi:MAG: 2-dehydropantoate 2-reductase [Anaerolineae bacterium]|nr:2-dehydropantoate 2-reductase [Anaerolineae bacterium]